MTKGDFISALAEKAGYTEKEAEKFLDAFNNVMINDIFKKEDKIAFPFGTLSGVTKKTSERNARNPKTGETIVVPAKTYRGLPKLKVSKTMKVEE